MITIDLNACPPGRWQTTVRWQHDDRELVDAAADLLGVPTAAFIRAVTYQAAQQVLGFNKD